MKSRKLQLIILSLIIFILSGPFFIYSVLKLSSAEVKAQNAGEGVEEKEKRPDFSLASWLKGDFQGGTGEMVLAEFSFAEDLCQAQ